MRSAEGITAILTLYRRAYTLEEQVTAVRNQSAKADAIWLWVNDDPANRDLNFERFSIDRCCRNDFNWKFYGRFALAMLADTEYVAIFDDDAIPGDRWFENCLKTMEESPGIMGTGGVRFSTSGYDHESEKYGWIHPSTDSIEVDFVGQAWFFRREWLSYFWRESPASWDNGEDMHFAFTAQKYGGIKSLCPPHPGGSCEHSGSMTGRKYDGDEMATSLTSETFYEEREAVLQEYLSRGWKVGDW